MEGESAKPSPPKNEDVERRLRVAKRWKILRQALTKQVVNKSDSFTGYGLLDSPTIFEGNAEMKHRLSKIDCTGNMHDQISSSILATLALDLQARELSFKVPIDYTVGESLASQLSDRCTLESCSISKDIVEGDCSLLCLSIQAKSLASQFKVMQYRVGTTTILARERVQLQISLSELSTHHEHSVDNTGNIRVWDCEKTLAWALQYMDLDLQVVTELGAGMAGIAALSLLSRGQTFQITDGHIGCVRNNDVNVLLMKAADMIGDDTNVVCKVLRWNTEPKGRVCPQFKKATTSLISDCTHFQEFHGELLWTLLNCTAVGGNIVMCHPDRGRSLANFLAVIDAVNDGKKDPVLRVERWSHETLDHKHSALKEQPDYDENVHRPKIFVLSVIRECTENDRLAIISHIKSR